MRLVESTAIIAGVLDALTAALERGRVPTRGDDIDAFGRVARSVRKTIRDAAFYPLRQPRFRGGQCHLLRTSTGRVRRHRRSCHWHSNAVLCCKGAHKISCERSNAERCAVTQRTSIPLTAATRVKHRSAPMSPSRPRPIGDPMCSANKY